MRVVCGARLSVVSIVTPAMPAVPVTENPEEWIELFNKGGAPVSLAGWKLDDAVTFTIQDQFLYGADLMVAPVIEAGAAQRRVYLPQGAWRHLWSGADYAPGWYDVPAPIGAPPVFYRTESAFAPLFEELVP